MADHQKAASKKPFIIAAVLAIVCVAVFAALMAYASTSGAAQDETLAVEDTIAVKESGLPDDLLSLPYITVTDDANVIVMEKTPYDDDPTTLALDAGTYTVSVVAPAVSNDGAIYVATEPTKTVSVETGTIPEFSFEFTELDPSDTEAVDKAKDELANVGVPEDVTSAVESKYPSTTDPAENTATSEPTIGSPTIDPDTPASAPSNPENNSTPIDSSSGSTVTPTPAQPAPTVTQPPNGSNQTHTHNWVATGTSDGYKYYTYSICAQNCGYYVQSDDGLRDIKDQKPSDYNEIISLMEQHKTQTGHGYKICNQAVSAGNARTIYTCSGCGATK